MSHPGVWAVDQCSSPLGWAVAGMPVELSEASSGGFIWVPKSWVVGLVSLLIRAWRLASALQSHWGQCLGLHGFSMSCGLW